MERTSYRFLTRFLPTALLFLSCAAFTACSGSPIRPSRLELRQLTEQETLLVSADNLFGLKLFRAVSEAEEEKNVFLSPLSISMALGMTLNGAAGETRTGMEETLELAGLTEDEINAAYRSLIDLLTGADPKVTFQIANSIWYREGYPIAPAFVEANQTYFDAVVQALDFSAADAVDIINAWVSEKTHDRIEEIVDPPIDPLTMMFLINAIYFKGTWLTRFNAGDTEDRPFYLTDGTEIMVPTMSIDDVTLPHYSGSGWSAVDLAYGDSLFSMTIIIPATGTDLDAFISGFDQTKWEQTISGFWNEEYSRFLIPKFELAYQIRLNNVLIDLGMDTAFDNVLADFSRMHATGERDLFISEVKHKTWLKIDERGSEAAAVTSVEMQYRSGPEALIINRPFIVVIRERTSGTILFIGKVMDPSD